MGQVEKFDTNSPISLVIFDDLETLKNVLLEFENKGTVFEIVFGFQELNNDLISELIVLQSDKKFLHCYGFDESVEDVLEILKSLCLYNNVLIYPDEKFSSTKTTIDNNFDFSSFYSLEKINLGILTCSGVGLPTCFLEVDCIPSSSSIIPFLSLAGNI